MGLFLVGTETKGNLETESTPGEGTVNITEMTTMDLENYIILVDEEVTRWVPVFSKALMQVECYQPQLCAPNTSFVKRRVN